MSIQPLPTGTRVMKKLNGYSMIEYKHGTIMGLNMFGSDIHHKTFMYYDILWDEAETIDAEVPASYVSLSDA